MPRQFKTARQNNKLKIIEAAKKLCISQTTDSTAVIASFSWQAGMVSHIWMAPGKCYR